MEHNIDGIKRLITQTKSDISELESVILDQKTRGLVTPDDEIDPAMKLKGMRVVLNSYEAVVRAGER